MAQTGREIKFSANDHPLTKNKNLVSVSVVIDPKQPISGNGIHFMLIVKNNSGKPIFLKNAADVLFVGLYNSSGFDIAISNLALIPINRGPDDRKWKFRSESVTVGSVYINGRVDTEDIKKQEYIEVPAGGDWKVDLTLKNVKKVETPQDAREKFLKPTITLLPGMYKLDMWVSIVSKDHNESGGVMASFKSPMIEIDYSK